MTALAGPGWDHEQRAQALMPRRDELVRALPKRFGDARRLSPDVREQIVDDSITYVAVHYPRPIEAVDELMRVFWGAVDWRVQHAREGRYDTVRSGYARVDLAALESVGDQDTPERLALERAETRVALQFAALLHGDARTVFMLRWEWQGRKEPGAERIATLTGLPLGRVRAAEVVIETQRQRFTRIYTAGRLCGFLAPGIAALAAGEDEHRLEEAARFHLEVEACPVCRADYIRQLRYVQGARFTGKVAQLLPGPVVVEHERRRTGVRDLVADWIARLLGNDTVVAPHLTGGAGRGLGGALGIKLAAFCTGGALCVCVSTVLPLRPDRAGPPQSTATPTPSPQRARATTTPSATPTSSPTATATPSATPSRKSTKRRRDAKTQGATGARSHEKRPASAAPANAAASGASEFDPTYQPSQPAPAPVPAAPGGSEFF